MSAPLWPHQIDAVAAVEEHFSQGGSRCTVVAACGTGKTRIGIEVTRRIAPHQAVLVIVPNTRCNRRQSTKEKTV